MNIVVVDSGQLTGDADFPEVNLPKFGWSQFVELAADEIEERCWRADIIISANTPVTAQVIENCFKLKLIIAAGDNTDHINHEAAKARGITIINIEGLTGDTQENTQSICNLAVQHINSWLDKLPKNTD